MGGLPVKELNLLELEFLRMNNYNINVPFEELQRYGDQLLMHSIKEREAVYRKEKVHLDQQFLCSKQQQHKQRASNESIWRAAVRQIRLYAYCRSAWRLRHHDPTYRWLSQCCCYS